MKITNKTAVDCKFALNALDRAGAKWDPEVRPTIIQWLFHLTIHSSKQYDEYVDLMKKEFLKMKKVKDQDIPKELLSEWEKFAEGDTKFQEFLKKEIDLQIEPLPLSKFNSSEFIPTGLTPLFGILVTS